MWIRVKERREELGLTQRQLAIRSGIANTTISDIESGKHKPAIDIAMRLAKALQCHVEDIFILKN